jgi:hypothetical protein
LIFSLDKSNIYNILSTAGSRLKAKHLEESIAKMSGENNPTSKKIYGYNKDNIITLSYEFSSYTEAAKFFNYHRKIIYNFINKIKYYKNKWILSSTKL